MYQVSGFWAYVSEKSSMPLSIVGFLYGGGGGGEKSPKMA